MNCIRVLAALLLIGAAAGCSGNDDEKTPPPAPAKEVKAAQDMKTGAMNKANSISKTFGEHQQAQKDNMDIILED